ncbi:hypothetical protein [Agromyces larvae]|uniref:Uncharacterized protein n=1 Tax=Agromyces larvae TaxID=2929802 RepID=A0ABY4C3C1_9MICO|nr:hypothetical protein [Agromyces larvae]UOE45965.1 hypothetical protein MTO99_09550 [Agromyces larvae]
MTRIAATGPAPLEIEVTSGRGNLPDEPEVHLAIYGPTGLLDMGWFPTAELRAAILQAELRSLLLHPRAAAYRETERNPAE